MARTAKGAQSNRDLSRISQAKRRAETAELGEIPAVKDWDRRNRCENDLVEFIRIYRFGFNKDLFQGKFYPDQIKQIRDIERAFSNSGNYAFANFRGGGKSSIISAFRFWAIAYGHSKWMVMVNASQSGTENQMKSFFEEIMENQLIKEDFPELHYPITHIQANSKRCATQTCEGVNTKFSIKPLQIILPDVSGSAFWQKCAGAIITSASPKTKVRGWNRNNQRPDCIIFDDIETDLSVDSEAETSTIENFLTACSGLGTQQSDIKCIWIGTIIKVGCLMDIYTTPTKKSAWNGSRYSYMKKFPSNDKLWKEYMKIRRNPELGGIVASREFYRDNREAMDFEAEVSWPEGFDPSKYDSAIEKYYAMWCDVPQGEKYVACELQNNPGMLMTKEDKKQLDQYELSKRLNGYDEGVIPSSAVGLAGFIDVQDPDTAPLYYMINWFNSDFGGGVHSWGTWPEDGQTMRQHYETEHGFGLGKDDVLAYAIKDLVEKLNEPSYERDNGTKIDLQIGIDSGAGQHQITTFAMARQNPNRNLINTKGVGLKDQVLGSRAVKKLREGFEWYINHQRDANSTMSEVINYESRRWKCFVRDRLQCQISLSTAFNFFGFEPSRFSLLYKHFCAEKSTEAVTPQGGRYTIWSEAKENHYWDTLIGTFVIASARLGIKLAIDGVKPLPKKKWSPMKVSLPDL